MSMGQFRGQDGNVSILLIAFCMGITLLMVLFLDLYSILYTRHAAQTAADGAVLGTLRVAQRVISPILAEQAETKIQQWEQETKAEYDRQHEEWEKARDAACPEEPPPPPPTPEVPEAPPSPPEVPEPPVTPSPPSRAECLAEWEEEHPAPVLEEIQRQFLEARLDEPAVVNAILYGEGVVETRVFLETVLSTEEILCTIRNARGEIDSLGRAEASNYARWNKAELTTLVVPYQDLPQIMVRVERPVPTLILGRYGTGELRAERVALATLVSAKHAEPIPDTCP